MKITPRARELQAELIRRCPSSPRASLADIQTYLNDQDEIRKWRKRNHREAPLTLAEALALGMPYFEASHETRLYKDNGGVYCELVQIAD